MTRIQKTVLAALALAVFTPAVYASGGSSAPTPEAPEAPSLTPEQEAIAAYQNGLKRRDQAWKLEEKAAATNNEQQRAKLEAKAAKQFQKAAKSFETAIQKKERFYQAYSSLGYALRRTEDYEAALVAYDEALSIQPRYTEAIEYRAEAYLGLNRLEDAKEAYMQLFRVDRPRADELMTAMQKWIATESEGASVDAAALDSFKGWVEERQQVSDMVESPQETVAKKW